MFEYKTKEQVHNRAKEAVGKTIRELNNDAPVLGYKSSVGDALKLGKQKIVKVVRYGRSWRRVKSNSF